MMHPLVTLVNGTEITYSDIQSDGRIKVEVKTTDWMHQIRHAVCYLPEFVWKDACQFSEEELTHFEKIIGSMYHTIIEETEEE